MDENKDAMPADETGQDAKTIPVAQEAKQEEPAEPVIQETTQPEKPVKDTVPECQQHDTEAAAKKEKPLCDVKVGDLDETTGEPIVYIAYATTRFIVSIDQKLNLNWLTANSYNIYAPDFGEVVGSCDLSDALVDRVFSDPKNRLAYKKMLGNVIARILDEKNSTSARKLLAIVDERINEHARERVRMSYIYAALTTVGIVGFLLAFTVYNQTYFLKHGLDELRYKIVLCTLLGGIGAFITTFARFQRYTGSLVAGVAIHRLDGFLRIFYGLIAGLIIILAIKADALIGFADQQGENIPYLFYFLAMVAGASEVLIPNLIKQSEEELGIKKLEKAEQEQTKKPNPDAEPNPNPESGEGKDQEKGN